MDCLMQIRLQYEKTWQECLAHVQACKVGALPCKPQERSTGCGPAGPSLARPCLSSLDPRVLSFLTRSRPSLASGPSEVKLFPLPSDSHLPLRLSPNIHDHLQEAFLDSQTKL